jgi:hypothetical protein
LVTSSVTLDADEQHGDYGVLANGRVLGVRAGDVLTGASAAAILRYPI